MPVEFLGIAATNDGSETVPRSGASFDKEYTLRPARAHEDHGSGRMVFAHGSGSPDPAPAAAKAAGRTDVPRIRVACRALWDTLSARGHDLLGDAVDVGRHVIPVVREESAGRDAERAARRTQTLAAVGG